MSIRLVAFDVDGTLIRGQTLCEVLADALGYLPRMQILEGLHTQQDIIAAREEMAMWYQSYTPQELGIFLQQVQWAPGAHAGIRLLQQHRIKIALVSITWEFAVAWVAQQLGIETYVGTKLSTSGQIHHFWPADKPLWVEKLARQYGLEREEVAAVGDSPSDWAMLQYAGQGFYVGSIMPVTNPSASIKHEPVGDILAIAQRLIPSMGEILRDSQ